MIPHSSVNKSVAVEILWSRRVPFSAAVAGHQAAPSGRTAILRPEPSAPELTAELSESVDPESKNGSGNPSGVHLREFTTRPAEGIAKTL